MRCELCGEDYYDETLSDEELREDLNSIEENGRCVTCNEEFGEEYPDRI